MQAARHLVGVLVELAARVQFGEYDLGGRAFRHLIIVLLYPRGDAAPVVAHGARSIGVQRHLAGRRVARENLVDSVVDDLVDHVMETRTVVGVADVHARPLAHGIEAFQHLDAVLAVVVRGGGFLGALGAHQGPVSGVNSDNNFIAQSAES